jgi:hypothetical protein
MNHVRSFSLQSFFRIFVVMLMLAVFCIASGVWMWRFIFSNFTVEILKNVSSQSTEMASSLAAVLPFLNKLKYFFIPCILFIFASSSLILWATTRQLFVRAIKNIDTLPDIQSKNLKSSRPVQQPSLKLKLKDMPFPEEVKPSDIAKKEDVELNQRFYLHLLSVLQREGRLLDFFSEDLGKYEDLQIGAAVRNIHENCKKALNKYLKPTAVIDKREGDEITVPKNFDINTIKLTGNVINDPPFQGVLRHRGWQVTKLDLPTLTSGHNPRIIAPAEVEIL